MISSSSSSSSALKRLEKQAASSSLDANESAFPDACVRFYQQSGNKKVFRRMVAVAKERFLGQRELQLQGQAGIVAHTLLESLEDTMLNRVNAVFCVLGPPGSGKKAVIRQCMKKLEPAWVNRFGNTPGSVDREAQRGRRLAGNQASSKRQLHMTPDSAGPGKRQRRTPGSRGRAPPTPGHSQVFSQPELAGDRAEPDADAPARFGTPGKNTGGVPAAGSSSSSSSSSAAQGINLANDSSALRGTNNANYPRTPGTTPGRGINPNATSSALDHTGVGVPEVNNAGSGCKRRVLKPVYLAGGLGPKDRLDDQQLFQSIIHQLGEHEQTSADDNSQRLQWLSEWIQFYTRRGYSVVLVVEQFEALLRGGTDRLLYSLFDLMTQNSTFHFFIVGGCCDPSVFSATAMNKRVLSRLELKTLSLRLPSASLGASSSCAGAGAGAPASKSSSATSSSQASPSAAAGGKHNPASSASAIGNRSSIANPATSGDDEMSCILKAHLTMPIEVREELCHVMTEGEWNANVEKVIAAHQKSRAWRDAAECGVGVKWFLSQLCTNYENFFTARLPSRTEERQTDESWLYSDLVETDCIVLVALHKIFKRRDGAEGGKRTWTDVLSEIDAYLSGPSTSAALAGESGKQVTSVLNVRDVTGMSKNWLEYRVSFEKLLEMGLVQFARTEKVWEHHPIFFTGQDKVNAWIEELRAARGGGGKKSLGGRNAGMLGFGAASSGFGGDGSSASSLVSTEGSLKNPLRGFSDTFESWARKLA